MSPRGCWRRVPCHGTVYSPMCAVSHCVCAGAGPAFPYSSHSLTLWTALPSFLFFSSTLSVSLSSNWFCSFSRLWTLILNVTTYYHCVVLMSFPVSLMVPWCPFMFQAFSPLLKLEFLSGVPISGAEESGLAGANHKQFADTL